MDNDTELGMLSRECAPVALFAFARPEHTRLTLDALAANSLAEKTELIAYCDGAKSDEQVPKVEVVRDLIRAAKGFRKITLVERNKNYGLARNITEGVTEVCNRYGRIIVLEDDIVVAPNFLEFMNNALDLYKEESRIACIHGYVYPVSQTLPELFLIRGADCWGWATWKRGWDLFEADGAKLLAELRDLGLNKEFDMNGSYPYTEMLDQQVRGKNDSWAIRWYASAFLKGCFTLYPAVSLVENIGHDGSGTHCASSGAFSGGKVAGAVRVERIDIEESQEARVAFESFFRSLRPSMFQRVVGRLKRWMLGWARWRQQKRRV